MAMKVTLRDAFWFVLVAAVVLAWWVDHRKQDIQVMKYEWMADATRNGFLLTGLEDFFEKEGYDFRWSKNGELEVESKRTDGTLFILAPRVPSE